jgi:hypothetical protein
MGMKPACRDLLFPALLLPTLLSLLFSCGSGKPDVSSIKLTVEIQRLDRDIFTKTGAELSLRYGTFFDNYTSGILNIGKCDEPDFAANLEMFRKARIVEMADSSVVARYPNLDGLTRKLSEAFKYYRYYFPDKRIPKVYACISGFNQSLILTDSVIAISLDKYLGADYKLYDNLGFSKYMSRNMTPQKILSDCISTWTGGEWFFDPRKNNTLLSKMIHEGKILYATKAILPDEADSLVFGFTGQQIKWCLNNESNMWEHLIGEKLLFATDYFKIKKLTEDAPFTSEFTSESPGKACNWVGYRIVSLYMKKHPHVTLSELMNDDNYNEIYRRAKYKP